MLLTDVHNYGHVYPPHNYDHFDADADYTTFSINPADYPPSELLCAPSPVSESNGTFCVEMGKFEGWRGDTTRTPSPSPSLLKEGEREKQKPRLTIAVPTSGSGAGSDAYYNHRRTRSYNVDGRRSAGYAVQMQTQTDVGDDVLDWGEDGSECDEGDESVEVTCGAVSGTAGGGGGGGAEIRRVRSTPPTPRSGGTYLYVPVSMSHLRACGEFLTMLWCGIPDTSQARCRVSVSMRLELAVTSRTCRQVVWIFIWVQIRFFVCLFVKVQDLWRPIALFDFIRIPSFIYPPTHPSIHSSPSPSPSPSSSPSSSFGVVLASVSPPPPPPPLALIFFWFRAVRIRVIQPSILPAVDSYCTCTYSIRINTSGWRYTYVLCRLVPKSSSNNAVPPTRASSKAESELHFTQKTGLTTYKI